MCDRYDNPSNERHIKPFSSFGDLVDKFIRNAGQFTFPDEF